jgi:hypothetical protein
MRKLAGFSPLLFCASDPQAPLFKQPNRGRTNPIQREELFMSSLVV